MHEQWSVDSAIHKLFHDRELGLLREDNVLDDDVGAFSELGQDNLDLAIALDLATKTERRRKELQVFVEDGVLVLSLQLFNGDVQMVILHHIQVVHRRVAIHRVRFSHGEVEVVKDALRRLTGEGRCQRSTCHTIDDQVEVVQGHILRGLEHGNEMARRTWRERSLSLAC